MAKHKKQKVEPVLKDTYKRVRYMGLLGARFICPICETAIKRGILVEDNGVLFCGPRCADKAKSM